MAALMCDDPSHAVFATEVARLQEENERLESLINRPVYVTVTPSTAYRPPDVNMTNISVNLANINTVLNSIALHLSTLSTEAKVANVANGIS